MKHKHLTSSERERYLSPLQREAIDAAKVPIRRNNDGNGAAAAETEEA